MSRSRRTTPIIGYTTSDSEKLSKRAANKKLRRIVKIQLKKGKSTLSKLREVSNVWSFEKDGKRYLKNPEQRDLRK